MKAKAKEPPRLRLHEKSCAGCRYYRIAGAFSECLLLGRTLSAASVVYADNGRLCSGWKRRPKKWHCRCEKNPHWDDAYIPRATLLRLRKRLGIKH